MLFPNFPCLTKCKIYTAPTAKRDTITKENILRYYRAGKTLLQGQMAFGALLNETTGEVSKRHYRRFMEIFYNLVNKKFITRPDPENDKQYTVVGKHAHVTKSRELFGEKMVKITNPHLEMDLPIEDEVQPKFKSANPNAEIA